MCGSLSELAADESDVDEAVGKFSSLFILKRDVKGIW